MYICYVYYVHASTQPGQKKAADTLKLKLQTVVNYLMQGGGGERDTQTDDRTKEHSELLTYLFSLISVHFDRQIYYSS